MHSHLDILLVARRPQRAERRPRARLLRQALRRAAQPAAAFEGRTEVTEDDVARVASCCLRHRLRKDPLEQVDSGDRVVKVFCKVFERSESSDRADFELALAA